jgi:hypothetical protein
MKGQMIAGLTEPPGEVKMWSPARKGIPAGPRRVLFVG